MQKTCSYVPQINTMCLLLHKYNTNQPSITPYSVSDRTKIFSRMLTTEALTNSSQQDEFRKVGYSALTVATLHSHLPAVC